MSMDYQPQGVGSSKPLFENEAIMFMGSRTAFNRRGRDITTPTKVQDYHCPPLKPYDTDRSSSILQAMSEIKKTRAQDLNIL